MKIAVIGPTYPYKGGISHYNSLLCGALAQKHDVFLINFKRQYPSFLFPGKDQKDFNSNIQANVRQEQVLDSMDPFSWLRVVARIKREKPDLLIMYWWTPFWAFPFSVIAGMVRKRTSTKVLFLCHNVLPHEKSRLDVMLTKMALQHGSYFITHSAEDSENLLRMIPHALVKRGHHPSYAVFNAVVMPKKKAQGRVGVEGNLLLFFGFVRPYKGLMHLIRAMPLILEKKDVTLLVVGEFWSDKKKYVEEIRRLGIEAKVVLVDKYVADAEIPEYFYAADIVVLPYETATNSGIVQTAFGFHKPVIVTRIGGLPEVVAEGKTGYVVAPRSPEEIARAVLAFYRARTDFAKNIRKEQKRFSWDKMVELIESFFNERRFL